MKEFKDDVIRLSKEDKCQIFTYVFITAHGVTTMINPKNPDAKIPNLNIVHPNYSKNIENTMKDIHKLSEEAQLEIFFEHFISPIQLHLNHLSKYKNVYVVAIINSCREILPFEPKVS